MKKIAIVRGKFLNRYEMQFYEPLVKRYAMTAFGSMTSYHDRFAFPVVKLPSPMDLPNFPYKMPILNRLFVDAHYLFGLEHRLSGFDIVHTAETYFHYTQQCLDAKKRGYVKKVVATVLENIPFNNEGIWGRKGFKHRARTELDHMIALTQKTKEAMVQEGADPRKITVISHFVDTKRFVPGKKSFNPTSLTILFAGRLETYKGVYDILDAATKLWQDRTLRQYQLDFVFVGDGAERQRMIVLERQFQEKWRFHHESATYDTMPQWYQKADIFIAPSKTRYAPVLPWYLLEKPRPTWEEQYCTALLEAQSAGLPIVTTSSGGIPENVGNAAILVPPGDVDALAAALREFILNSKKRDVYAKRARNRAVTVHDIHFGAAKLDELYTNLLNS